MCNVYAMPSSLSRHHQQSTHNSFTRIHAKQFSFFPFVLERARLHNEQKTENKKKWNQNSISYMLDIIVEGNTIDWKSFKWKRRLHAQCTHTSIAHICSLIFKWDIKYFNSKWIFFCVQNDFFPLLPHMLLFILFICIGLITWVLQCKVRTFNSQYNIWALVHFTRIFEFSTIFTFILKMKEYDCANSRKWYEQYDFGLWEWRVLFLVIPPFLKRVLFKSQS